MGISYKSLLPKQMQSTRWGQFIDAFQSIIDDVVLNIVTPIKTRFIYNLMTQDQIVDMCAKLGFKITYKDGYTVTSNYFLKELLTIVPRIYSKTTKTGYKYIFKIFNLNADVYPIFYTFNNNKYTFQVQDNYWNESVGIAGTYRTLDESPPLTLDSTLVTLDSNSTSAIIPLRHFVISYINNFIEDITQFLSINTQKAFYNDVQYMKRSTEIPYFEPIIKLSCPSGSLNIPTGVVWTDYQLNKYTNQTQVLFKNNLSGITSIQLGNSGFVNANNATGGVQSLKYTITNNTSGMQYITTPNANIFKARKLVTEKFKFLDNTSSQLYFTEMAVIGGSGQCIAYTTFPKIQWYPYMYQSLKFDISII